MMDLPKGASTFDFNSMVEVMIPVGSAEKLIVSQSLLKGISIAA